MTEAEFQEEQKKHIRMIADLGYDKGFYHACDLFEQALSLLPPINISVEHAIKLVGIIRRSQKEKEAKIPNEIQELLNKKR